MLKILQARLQQYVDCELPGVQAGFGKGRGTRDQIANIIWVMEETREFQKNIYFCLFDYAKAFDCVDHNKLWKILKEILYIVTLLIQLLCRVQHEKCWAGRSTRWNQDCREKYQSPQIYR